MVSGAGFPGESGPGPWSRCGGSGRVLGSLDTANTMEHVVHLRTAVCMLGRFPALAGIDLDVAPGQVVLLVGPNGAGKTTLLRACAGLVPVVQGEAVVLGHDLRTDRRVIRRRIGLLGHASFLYEDLSVQANLDFWARAAGATATDADLALTRVGLQDRLRDVPVNRLSAGQRRRVSLAALVARRPELWLLDEPNAGLDADGRDLLDDLLTEAVGVGATVLMASHELERAVPLADRVVRLDGGMVTDVSAHPETVAISGEVTHGS